MPLITASSHFKLSVFRLKCASFLHIAVILSLLLSNLAFVDPASAAEIKPEAQNTRTLDFVDVTGTETPTPTLEASIDDATTASPKDS